jgi:hypothetical protein
MSSREVCSFLSRDSGKKICLPTNPQTSKQAKEDYCLDHGFTCVLLSSTRTTDRVVVPGYPGTGYGKAVGL